MTLRPTDHRPAMRVGTSAPLPAPPVHRTTRRLLCVFQAAALVVAAPLHSQPARAPEGPPPSRAPTPAFRIGCYRAEISKSRIRVLGKITDPAALAELRARANRVETGFVDFTRDGQVRVLTPYLTPARVQYAQVASPTSTPTTPTTPTGAARVVFLNAGIRADSLVSLGGTTYHLLARYSYGDGAGPRIADRWMLRWEHEERCPEIDSALSTSRP